MSARERDNQNEYMVTRVGDFAAQYAMMPVHAFAFPTAVDDLAEVCRRHGGALA